MVTSLCLLVLVYLVLDKTLYPTISENLWPAQSNFSYQMMAEYVQDQKQSIAPVLLGDAPERNATELPKIRENKSSTESERNATKTILFATGYFIWPYFGMGKGNEGFVESGCPYTNCYTTVDMKLADEADAVVFHGLDMDINMHRYYSILHNLKTKRIKQRHWKQLFVLFAKESPRLQPTSKNDILYNFFNLTMTYRTDADIILPYGKIVRKNIGGENSEEKFNANHVTPKKWMKYDEGKVSSDILNGDLRNRTLDIAWLVSHCGTDSKREKLYERLKSATNLKINMYGKCADTMHQLPADVDKRVEVTLKNREGRYMQVLAKYKFYLSFENALCLDYITEKFFLATRAGALPVVYGGASKNDYDKIAPPHSHVRVEDFPSVVELARHLEYLAKNQTAYNTYFWWREHYDPMQLLQTQKDAYCRLCEKLNSPYKPSQYLYPSYHQYWSGTAKCRSSTGLFQ